MKTVLVVENDPMSRELSKRVLRAGGYRVECANDAEEALRMVPRLSPDLVLMDVRLPGMDGIEATRRLRSRPRTAAIPVAVLSAQAFHEDVERARSVGCVEYLTKPIGARELLERVARIIGDGEKALGVTGGRAGSLPQRRTGRNGRS